MKQYIGTSLKLSLVMLVLCCGIYFGLITLIGKLAPGGGSGETVQVNGKTAGYALLGQKFTNDKYFLGRLSAVDYNAAGSGGSNKAFSNPDYIKTVQDRIDTFLVHNPGTTRAQIPADMVTASGSGLDPDISPEGAYIQVKRVASVRCVPEAVIKKLVDDHVEAPLLGFLGTSKVNVLKLNIAVDKLKETK